MLPARLTNFSIACIKNDIVNKFDYNDTFEDFAN